MKKFKLLLVAFFFLLLLSFITLTSEEFGISAYVEKQKSLDKIYIDNQ